ncbi:MAG: hypothetical protein J7525_19755 [Roseofilum sp. SID3]|uniref:hypothetical protein n=1 Tax=Roseofilum sp. SID3 TaxID=2821499 RepID=UPI001B2C1520|nr:hypothetical protein [Roseofilum sp. SID3]MBP0015332.1 hypothetical protein [Roseofilum sp. SID3]
MTKQFCVLLPATEHNLISYFRQRNYHNVVIIDRKDYSAMNESLKDHIVADPQQYQALLSSAKYSLSLKSLSV